MGDAISLQSNPGLSQLEMVGSGIVTLNYVASSGVAGASLTHRLGYSPLVLAWQVTGSSYQALPIIGFDNPSGTISQLIIVSSSIITATVSIFIPTGSSLYALNSTKNIKIVLARERANQ